jgi:hypothetical protein
VFVDVVGNVANPRKADRAWGKSGWKVEPIVTTQAIGIAPDGGNQVAVRSSATALSKFAPAKAYATAYGENGGGDLIFNDGQRITASDVVVLAVARANGKPAPTFGTLISKSDGTAISGGDVLTAGNAVVLSSSRATGGTGITVATGYGRADSAKAAAVGMDVRANSAKWYASPGAAFAGSQAYGRGGHVDMISDTRARADLGTAIAGTLAIAKSNGVQPTFFDGVGRRLLGAPVNDVNDGGNGGNIIYNEVATQGRIDVGATVVGSMAVDVAETNKVVIVNDNTDAAAAVGTSTAGAINIGISNNNDVLIGDYDNSDATQNEVTSKVRGRGSAQAGMFNLGEWFNGGGGEEQWAGDELPQRCQLLLRRCPSVPLGTWCICKAPARQALDCPQQDSHMHPNSCVNMQFRVPAIRATFTTLCCLVSNRHAPCQKPRCCP